MRKAKSNNPVFLIDEVHNDQNYLHELLLGLTEKKLETVCILLGLKEGLEEFFSQKSELADLVSFYDFPTVTDENLVKILEKKLNDAELNAPRERTAQRKANAEIAAKKAAKKKIKQAEKRIKNLESNLRLLNNIQAILTLTI